MNAEVSYKDWYIPFKRDQLSLQMAYDNLQTVGADQADIPFIIRLVENPALRIPIPGLEFFHGAVELQQHDLIHIILGRGLLEVDEAFTIGFTMGSTNKVTTSEENLFSLISKYLYPPEYKFSDESIAVFKDAVRLGGISSCQPLDSVELARLMNRPLYQVREELGLEAELVLAYYNIEKNRYPHSVASRRLLDD